MITSSFKQRIVGAIFILSLGVILIPIILDAPEDDTLIHFSEKPQAPALPQVNDLTKINYVFNEVQSTSEVVTEDPLEAVIAEVTASTEPAPALITPPESAPIQNAAAKIAQIIPDPAPAPKAAQPLIHKGEWTIQLGAFSSADNAKELLARLSKEGFESYLQQSPGSKLVRVFVAPGVEKEQAQALLTKLDTQFGIKGIVVRYREE